MKNIIKINIVLLIVLFVNMVQVQAQTIIDNPQEEAASDCKTNIVEPEFIYTYPPDDDLGDPGDEEDDEDDENTDEEEFENKRRVMFVHGYQGNSLSWSQAFTFLDNQNNKDYEASNNTYITEGFTTLDQIASEIKFKNLSGMSGWPEKDKRRNFFIAHSMGGMALRFMQNKFGSEKLPYGGIITVGSGHKGVYAASVKEFKYKVYEDFVYNTCATLLVDVIFKPFDGIIENIAGFPILLNKGFVRNAICEKIAMPVADYLLSNVIDANLTVESAATYPQELIVDRKLCLYGIEEDEMDVIVTLNDGTRETRRVTEVMAPKFIGSFLSEPNGYPFFGADASDGVGLSTFSEILNHFSEKLGTANAKYTFQIRNGNYAGARATKKDISSYTNILKWIRDFNFQYQQLIGGVQNIMVTHNKCECLLEEDGMGNTFSIHYNYTGDCSNLIDTYIDGFRVLLSHPVITIESQKFESDGFVLANSASAMPGARRQIRMQGSGHFQMRNDSNLGTEFDKIFKENAYGTFWHLYK